MCEIEEVKTKVCSKCKIEKSYSEFHKNKSNKNGIASCCAPCQRITLKESYLKHKEIRKKEMELWRCNNKEYRKEYELRNKQKIREKRNEYRNKNKDKINLQNREKYKNNKEYFINYRIKNKERIKKSQLKRIDKKIQYDKEYRNKNKEIKSNFLRKYYKNESENLTDSYISGIMKMKKETIPPELIELKRIQLKLHRLLKENENDN